MESTKECVCVIPLTAVEKGQKKALSKQLPAYLSAEVRKQCEYILTHSDFEGQFARTVVSYVFDKNISKIVFVGLGKKDDMPLARAREIGICLAKNAFEKNKQTCVLLDGDFFKEEAKISQLIIGVAQGNYSYPSFVLEKRSDKEEKKPLELILVHPKKDLTHLIAPTLILIDGLNTCRLLQDGPPNVVTTTYISSNIQELAKNVPHVKTTVFGKKDLEKMGCHALLAVGSGSMYETQMVLLQYTPPSASAADKPLVLVGKGVTMDTGGYSLKPAGSMKDMKYDMSGSAVVLSSLLTIARLQLPVKVYAVAALCENMVDAHAYRVGDILVGHSGKSIEILNTDAEGRVALSDALSYAAKDLDASHILEFSTLTGAMVSALGHIGAGVFTPTDESFLEHIQTAADKGGERIWPLPSWEEVGEDTRGTLADVNNIGATAGAAGSMVGAMFLKEFVHGKPFAHVDIAGVAQGSQAVGYPRKISSGFGVQLAVELARLFVKS